MLTISKPLSAGQAQTYHQKEFTAKEQNYWSQRGVIADEWQGRLAAQEPQSATETAPDNQEASYVPVPADVAEAAQPAA